jgi:hypothetical protein
MVKITEKQILQQQNEQYKNHLADVLYKPFVITFQNIYNSVVENTTNDRIILKIFQKKLSKIPNWNRERIFKIYNTMIKVKCDYFEKLLNKVYQKNIKILLLDIPKEKKNSIKISIPSAEVFIHTCLVYIARELWKRPFLLYHLTTSIERQKNLYEIEKIITNKIFTVITDSLPIDLILENQKEEHFDESEEESEEEEEPEEEDEEQEEVSSKESEESDEDNTEETEKEIEEESEEESEDTEKEIEEENDSESESESESEEIEKESEIESEDSSEEDINSQYQMIQEMELSNNKEIENTVVEENNNLTNDTIIEEEQVSVEPIIEEPVSKESSNGELIIEEVPIIEETSISKQEDNEENTDIEQQVIDIIETDIDSKEEINYQEEKEDKEEKKEKSYRINNTADIIEKIRLHKKKKNKKIKDAFF